MASITAPTYDPTSTAQALAQKTTAAAQQSITTQNSAASATAKALSSLSSALSSFQSSLGTLTGLGKSMLAQSATLSDTGIGQASAKAQAAAGSYSVFVEQLASASQVSHTLPASSSANGQLTLTLAPPNGSAPATPPSASFTVDLDASADTDGVSGLSPREIAAAINRAQGNNGLVSAGLVTVGEETRLVLTSKATGVANTVWLSASGNADLQADLGARNVVSEAKNAVAYFGAVSDANRIEQASNTFTNIDGVSLTVTRAQKTGDAPVTLSVAGDNSATVANVQGFVDAYNRLKTAIDALAAPGDSASGTAAGVFAHDAGVKALQSRLVSLMRTSGSPSLASYGITAARDGTLTLDSTRLSKQLAANPNGLDQLIGSASATSPSGIAGALNTYLGQWSNSTNGQIKQRTEANSKLQSDLTKRQSDLDAKYDSAYQRYLKQFTQLQSLQATMNSNVSMFDALFSNDKS